MEFILPPHQDNEGKEEDERDEDSPQRDAVMVGHLQLMVFEDPDEPTEHLCMLSTDQLMKTSLIPWLEAAACLTAYASKNSREGMEKTLELITEKAINYKIGNSF